jgi:hypothetical protein
VVGFLDSLGIGNQPDQLSLPEILSAIPAIAGPVLMARGKRVGLPLGIGLSAIGGLGQTLAERQRTQAQHSQLGKIISTMPGVTDQQKQMFGQLVSAGVNPETILPEVLKGQFRQAKPLGGLRAAAAGELGLPLDETTWTPEQWKQEQGTETGLYRHLHPEKEAKQSLMDRYFAEHPGAKTDDFESWYQRNKLAGEKPPQPSWRTETDPTTGATVQNAYHYNPKSGKMELVPTEGDPGGVPAKLDTNERKQLDAVRLVSTQIPRMGDLVNQLPPDTSPAMLAREYAKFRAPFGALGAVDPKFEAYFQQIGQLKAALISSAASGFRGQYMINMLKQHIPSETDPPARAMEKIQGFDAGGFNAILQNYLGAGKPIAPSGGGATSGGTPPKPSFDVDKTYQKDGRWYVKDKAGKFYQFDGSQWIPL